MTNISTEINRILDARDDSFDAVEEKGVVVPTGSTIDDLPSLIRSIPTGAGSAISIVDTTDANGGTIRTITAVSLAGDTVSPSSLLSGYTAHNALGEPIVGTASGGSTTIESLSVTENGTYTAPTGKAYSPVYVSVQGQTVNNQNKSVTPTESQQEVTYDSGYTGLGTVTVGAISSTYVGTGITRRSSTDLTASGATVTVPSGYYSAQATKSVSTMTLPTSASSSATSGYTSKATISRSTSDQYINIPTGYNTAGAYYKVNAVANGSVTAPSSVTGTSASVSTGTNTLTLSKTVSITPNVTTAGYISSGTAGNATVSLTASVTTQAAKTVTPTKSSQTAVSSGTYCTGAITVAAIPSNYIDTTDATATASQINSGATAYVNGVKVTGEQVIQTYYTGTSNPSSSLGSNGDIYLKTVS